MSFHIRPRRGVKAFDVVQQLHVKRVTVKDGNGGTLECTCGIARETDVADGVKRIEWRLMTNRIVNSVDEATESINWYRARWEIEMYFDVI